MHEGRSTYAGRLRFIPSKSLPTSVPEGHQECSRYVESAGGGRSHRIVWKNGVRPGGCAGRKTAMPSTHFSLQFHVVFSTKDRAPNIIAPWRERLHAYLGGIVRELNGVVVIEGAHDAAGLRGTHPWRNEDSPAEGRRHPVFPVDAPWSAVVGIC